MSQNLETFRDQSIAVPSTADLLAAYDAGKRAQAENFGEVLDRTAFSFLAFDPSKVRRGGKIPQNVSKAHLDVVLRLDDQKRPEAFGLSDAGIKIIDEAADQVSAVINAAYPLHSSLGRLQVAFEDPECLNAVTRHCAARARRRGEEAQIATRMLGVRSSLALSVLTPVLTQVLGLRYWLPSSLDEHDLADWAKALGLSQRNYTGLWDAARAGTEARHMIGGAESSAVKGGRFRGAYAAASSFKAAGSFAARVAGSLADDPVLRERNVIEGTVVKFNVHQADQAVVSGSVTDPAMFRVDRRYIAHSDDEPNRTAVLECTGMTVVEGRYLIEFRGLTKRQRGARMVRDAADSHPSKPLFLTQQPYIGSQVVSTARPWQGEGREWRPREVPLDIALAGA
jgi:hypothetical protein